MSQDVDPVQGNTDIPYVPYTGEHRYSLCSLYGGTEIHYVPDRT